jgi:hypothetical protein
MNLQDHLLEIGACHSACDWAGERTASEAWRETTRPDWLLWWRLKAHPEDRYKAIKLIVPLLREHTVPLARDCDRDVCERALRSAEVYADAPTPENRKAAYAAADAAHAAAYAAAYAAPADAAAAYAAAYAAAAAAAAAADDAATYARENIRAIWCAAIRSLWLEPPWKEGQ